MPLNTDMPSWLVQQFAPNPPTPPWMLQALQQGMERQRQNATLPLEIQGMQLQNKAHVLMIEHQGLANDLQNQEMNDFQADLPSLRAAKEQARTTPGGSLAMFGISFRSKKAMDLWQEQQKMDAATAYGQAIHQATIDQVKAATEAMRLTGKVIKPQQDGTFDPAELAKLMNEANDLKLANTAALYRAEHPDFTSPQTKTVYDESGNPITMVQESPMSWKPLQENTIEVKDPNGNIISVRQGAKSGAGSISGNNQAVDTAVQKKITENERSLSLIAEAIPLISPTTVGPVGAAREGVETAANIVKPGSVATTATDARQTFRIAAQNQYASLKADSQINKLEAAAMNSIVDITKLNMSDPQARRKYQILQDLTALQNVLMHHQLNHFAPDNALKSMSAGQAARAWKRGDLTNAEIERWNELNQFVVP